jgi:hypothetical protein
VAIHRHPPHAPTTTHSFSLCFGKSASGFIGSPATYFLFRDVGGAPNDVYMPKVPFLLYA